MYLPHIFTSGRTHHTATEKPLHIHTAIKMGLYSLHNTSVSQSPCRPYTSCIEWSVLGRDLSICHPPYAKRPLSCNPLCTRSSTTNSRTRVRVPRSMAICIADIPYNYQLLRRTYTVANRRPCSSMHNYLYRPNPHPARCCAVPIRAHRPLATCYTDITPKTKHHRPCVYAGIHNGPSAHVAA